MNREGEYQRTIVKVSKLTGDIKTGGHNYPWEEPIGNLLTSTLSYFRLPPEASSQGVLSSSVSFMNDAGNTIWRWLRSW